jgi:flagellar biosynthesis/type III secretory pathway protein FliH
LDLQNLLPVFVLIAAQEKAQKLLADAQANAEQVRAEAVAVGTAAGREEAKQELLPSLTAFANAGQALIIFEQQMIEAYKAQLVRLALDIAEQICAKAVEEDAQITASVLDRARREVGEAKRLRVVMNPADWTVLAAVAAELLRTGNESGRQIEVVAAEDVGRGGVRLETEIGVVDATVPVQFAEFRRQLLDEDVFAAELEELPASK